ncbi:uncharacterized protein LOC131614010 [Vicia villosa]|uniref:uncharacterized protein LOC131614010 n=1 Tax=Vicia villosa TaxID=3911 RepID=UPI00273B26AB|nr:uncharacterized protein LOC131614010 [Vicia villosa]
MKLHIKEQLRNIGYPEAIDMKLPSQLVKTKDAPKKMKPTPNVNSTIRSPSYCEHVDKLFPDSPTPKSQKKFHERRSHKQTASDTDYIENSFIDEMSVFMHKYIERIVNVEGNGNCGYRAVSTLLGKGEDSHALVRHQLIQELKTHKDSYTQLYGEKDKLEAVYESLVPWLSGHTLVSKLMRFLEMGNLIAYAYDRVFIDLTHYGFSKTFFLLRTAPPRNPNDRIMCIGWLAKSSHFVQVYLKHGCPIPLTSPEWATLHDANVKTWPGLFVDRMHEFERLNNIENESNAENESSGDVSTEAS